MSTFSTALHLAGVSAFASLAIAGGIVTTTQVVQLVSIEISKDVVGTGTMLVLDEFFFSEEMGAMDQLINYLTEAADYSENNGEVVMFSYGNATPNQWGTNIFIQYGTQEPITLSSTVVYLELQYPIVKP